MPPVAASGGSHLAARAPPGGAPAAALLRHRLAAAPAGLAVAAPHLQLLLEAALLALQVGEGVVGQRGAVVLRRLVEDLDERPVEPPDLHGRQRRDLAVGPQAGV